ncbi:hypothetical protein PPSIR1_38791 [Plesiocystis pacifica SIR-1]|uniref:Response regulatory domain-containing protein n=1 Tax=Plesiocystis pacifica SIR-1 TaxID=391625 RepID=A6G8T1_9BACT|nr:response regulator [Plesiocystis pacifica]EDM77741.1 hypothetical protein PPSIR1_38791 [Plesiocystis pacifica SIR-1]
MTPPDPLKDCRILLVDDHDDLAENLTEILEEEGAQVTRAARASEALDRAVEGLTSRWSTSACPTRPA